MIFNQLQITQKKLGLDNLINLEYTFSCCPLNSIVPTVWQILNEFKTSLNLTVALHSNSCLLGWNCVKSWHTFCKFWHFISSKNFSYQFHLTFHYRTITSINLRRAGPRNSFFLNHNHSHPFWLDLNQ